MADRRRGAEPPAKGTPEYRWLYGEETGRPASDEETRQFRAAPHDVARQYPPAPAPGTRPAPAPGTRPAPAPGVRHPGRPAAPPEYSPAPTAPTAPAPARPRGRGRRPVSGARKVWRTARILLLLWLVFLVATPLFAWSKVNRVEATGDYEGRPADQPGTTYLVVGSDSRAGLTKEQQEEYGTGGDDVGQRTDTIMLLHTGSGPNVLTSIPRDSRVPVPGHGTSKINAAYAWGGAPLLVRTVEQATGVRVDHYVEIGFGGLVRMVDAVGGVQICPTRRMKDKQANLDIEAGCQEADGATALGYARSRKTYKALGDVDRARAQREVVAALGREALSPMTVVNPLRYWNLSTATAESFTVSDGTSSFALARFGWAMTRVDGENGLTCGVPLRNLAVTWDETRAEQFFGHLRNDTVDEMPAALCTASGFPDPKG